MSKRVTDADILELAADLIARPGTWARNWTALEPVKNDKNGRRRACLAGDPDADQWGGTGAIYKVGMARGLSPADCHRIQGLAAAPFGSPWFSDWAWAFERTQEEVVGALRAAASRARQPSPERETEHA